MIRNEFIDTVHIQINNRNQLTKKMKDQLFSQLDKKEFLLIECFVRFFANLITDDEAILQHFRKAILRLCITLVLERKKWDKLFLKRSLIKEISGEYKMIYLHFFMIKWIENYSQKFTDHFMIAKSPLHIDEEEVKQRINHADKRRGTYLNHAVSNTTGPRALRLIAIQNSVQNSEIDNSKQQANQDSNIPSDGN